MSQIIWIFEEILTDLDFFTRGLTLFTDLDFLTKTDSHGFAHEDTSTVYFKEGFQDFTVFQLFGEIVLLVPSGSTQELQGFDHFRGFHDFSKTGTSRI